MKPKFIDQRAVYRAERSRRTDPDGEHVARGLTYRIALDFPSREALKAARAKLNAGRSVCHGHSIFVRVAIQDFWKKVEAMTTEDELYVERKKLVRARLGEPLE